MTNGTNTSIPMPVDPGPFSMRFPGWTDSQGWVSPAAYTTIVVADVDGDGQAEIMGALGSTLQTWHFDTTLGQWYRLADTPNVTIMSVEAFDLDGDGQAELVVSATGELWGGEVSSVETLHFDKTSMTWAVDTNQLGWAAAPANIACGRNGGAGQLFVRNPNGVYVSPYPVPAMSMLFENPPNGPLLTDAAGWAGIYASTMRAADLDGDGNSELIIRGADGIHVFSYDASSAAWTPDATDPANGPALTDAAGWSQPQYYSTIQFADINGDGKSELVASGPGGLYVLEFVNGAWTSAAANGPKLNAATWSNALYYGTITCADVDGDGRAEIVARGPSGVYIFDYDPTTQTWTPDSDAGPANGPPWSDAAGWNQPQYSLTLRAADVNGDSRAEIMGRLFDGVHTWQFTPSTSSWADTSAPFPSLQPGAYSAISTALGIANGDLRSIYSDAIATLTAYQVALGNEDFLSSHSLDASWQPSVDQLNAEVTSVIAVQGLFAQYATYLSDITLNDKINLDSVAMAIQLSQDVQQGKQSITANIFEMLSGIVWSLSAYATDAPMLAVVSGIADSALGFATSLTGGQTVSVNPVVEKYEAINTQISTSFNALRTANDANQAAILGDYGRLMTIGSLIGSGVWIWPVDPNPDPETITEAAFTLWAWQTLGAVAWVVYDAIYVDGIGPNRAPPKDYPDSWFWWSPKTPTPGKPFSETQHCRWLLLGSAQHYAEVSVTVLQQLFDAAPTGLGVSVSDVMTQANGWAIQITNQ